MNHHRNAVENAIAASIRRQREMGSVANAFGHYWEIVNGVLVAVGEIPDVTKNILPTQGINNMLNTWLLGAPGTTPVAGWYLALYANAINPAASWTAANVAATAGEITSTSEGYTEATRPQYTANAAANGIKDNVGNESTFTIATASELAVEGVFLISDNARGGTAGVLASAARYPVTRKLQNGDSYKLGFRTTITST